MAEVARGLAFVEWHTIFHFFEVFLQAGAPYFGKIAVLRVALHSFDGSHSVTGSGFQLNETKEKDTE